MSELFFYDTETTGLPLWKEPSEAEGQPHIVQLAAKLVDSESRELIASMDVIIRPDGWTIPAEVIAVHGITNEHALAVGISEADALDHMFGLWQLAQTRIGHNESFDARIVRIASKRFAAPELIEDWKEGQAECTGKITRPILQMEPKTRFGFKMPKLAEAYEYFTGKPLENAHNAMADVDACIAVYFAAQDYLAMAEA